MEPDIKTPWGALSVPSDEHLYVRANNCTVFIRSYEDEWRFSHEYNAAQPPRGPAAASDAEQASTPLTSPSAAPMPSDGAAWIRYVTVRNDTMDLVPALPDRPLVVRPTSAVSILPERSGRFFFSVPVWLRFRSVSHKKPVVITEIPTVVLSNIWFGEPFAGELCYSLDSTLERHAEDIESDVFRAVCPLFLTNSSTEPLSFERICVHVENLSLFETHATLWTNEVRVSFRGPDHANQIQIGTGPPDAAADGRQVTEPRRRPDKNIIRRSFSLFKHVTGF